MSIPRVLQQVGHRGRTPLRWDFRTKANLNLSVRLALFDISLTIFNIWVAIRILFKLKMRRAMLKELSA